MKISLVITNYNYERFIAETIESALAQDHPDVEIIVCDDGSTDNSRDVISRYDGRIKRIDQVNGGMRAAYNGGYSLVTGDLVVFLDADDWLYPTACSTIAKAWKPGVTKVQYFLDLVDLHGKPMGRRVPRHMHTEDALETVCDFGIYGTAAGSGNAYSAEFLRKVMPLDTTLRYMPADSEPINFAPAFGEIVSVSESLGAYRIHKKAGSDPLLLNNMPTSTWSEFRRMLIDKQFVAKRFDAMGIKHRWPMYLAPWEARLYAVCRRFGGPQPSDVVLETPNPMWFAFRSLWAWTALSVVQRLAITGWMIAVLALPQKWALRLAHLNTQKAGNVAAAAGSGVKASS